MPNHHSSLDVYKSLTGVIRQGRPKISLLLAFILILVPCLLCGQRGQILLRRRIQLFNRDGVVAQGDVMQCYIDYRSSQSVRDVVSGNATVECRTASQPDRKALVALPSNEKETTATIPFRFLQGR